MCINRGGREIQRSKRIKNSIAAPAKQSQVTLSFHVRLESTSAIKALSTSSSVRKGHEKDALAWATSQISSRDRALALVGIADALLTSTQAADTRH
jgi:hypothetical protein